MTTLSDFQDDSYSATFCVQDNKLRLYTGRVPRECYDILFKMGWKSTPKQDCDFVITWSPTAEDACYALIAEDDDIGDEDYSPEERAADRAERFSGYRESRREEASDFADDYEAGPSAFGHQNQSKAERAAAKHERLKKRGLCQWSKAEYWQTRTQGVINNALHKLDAKTRRGRILELEKDIRKRESSNAETCEVWDKWEAVAAIADPDTQTKAAIKLAGSSSGGWYDYPHPDNPERTSSLYGLLSPSEHVAERPITGAEAASIYLSKWANPHSRTDRWLEHYKLRLQYEETMLENEGGKAADVEMEPGGWLGDQQIHAVNRSPVTKRVVSVKIKGSWGYTMIGGKQVYCPHADKNGLTSVNIERMGMDAYRPPTDEEREQFAGKKKAAKKEAQVKAKENPKPALINPTPECAARLQIILNASQGWSFSGKKEDKEFISSTQKAYSSQGTGEYSPAKTVLIGHDGRIHRESSMGHANNVPVFKVRTFHGRVVVLTDKPQKKLPWEQMENIEDGLIPEAEIIERLPEIQNIMTASMRNYSEIKGDDWKLFTRAWQLGYVSDASMSQKFLTDKAYKAINAQAKPLTLDELAASKVFANTKLTHISDPKEIVEMYEDNAFKVRNAGCGYSARKSEPIRNTGWYMLTYSYEHINVCLQTEFDEAMKGELQNA